MIHVITSQSDFMCATEADAAEAKRRAEWLHKHKAPKDWIVLTNNEISTIRAELEATERELDEVRKELDQTKDALGDALVALALKKLQTDQVKGERDEWRITASSLKAWENELIKENAKLRDIAERLFAAGVGRMKTDDWRTLRSEFDQLKEGAK